MDRVVRETLSKLGKRILQSEKNASRGADDVEGTWVLVSYLPLEQGGHEPTTTW